jgi:hypothetical protein
MVTKTFRKEKKVGAATLLDSRGVLERPVVEGVSWLDAMRFFLGEARWFFLERATAIPCDGVGFDAQAKLSCHQSN